MGASPFGPLSAATSAAEGPDDLGSDPDIDVDQESKRLILRFFSFGVKL